MLSFTCNQFDYPPPNNALKPKNFPIYAKL